MRQVVISTRPYLQRDIFNLGRRRCAVESRVELYVRVICFRFCDWACFHRAKQEQPSHEDDETEIENWSSTHSVKTKAYLQPESVEEVSNLIMILAVSG